MEAIVEEVTAVAATSGGHESTTTTTTEGTTTLAIRAEAVAPSSRSSAEIPRSIAGSSIVSTSVPNESLTLMTDYDHSSSIVRFTSLDSPPPTFFFEHRRSNVAQSSRQRRARRGFLHRWMPMCFRGTSDVDESYRQAPPSYSTVAFIEPNIPQEFNRSHLAVLIRNDDPSTSFIVRTPPPSYAQAQGVTYSLEQLISNSDDANDMRMWTARPTSALCQRCASLVYTVVQVRRDIATHITALALCMMGCWPCCILPYCMDSCKKSHHYCPFCRTYLGTYTPW